MIVTRHEETFGGLEVWVQYEGGEHLLACITALTEPAATQRFVELAQQHAEELADIGKQYDESVAKNIAAGHGRGRYYRIFGARERRVRQLLDQAGVIDS